MSDNAEMNVSIGAHLDGLLLGMKEASGAVRESTEQMKLQFESLNGVVKSLAVPFAALTTLLAGGEMFEHAMESTSQFAVELEVMHQKTGMSVESLSALKFAADLSHVSFEELNTALVRFARNIYEAGSGVSTAGKAITDLQLRTKDAHGELRPMSDLLLDVADRFRNMPDGTQKAAIAMELFGRSGAQLIPFLNQGRDGIAELEAKAKALGVTMTEDGVAKMIAYEDAVKEVHAAGRGLLQQLAVELAPALTDVAHAFLENVDGGNAFHTAMSVLSGAVRLVSGTLVELIGVLKAVNMVMSADLTKPGEFAAAWQRAGQQLKQTGEEIRAIFEGTGTPGGAAAEAGGGTGRDKKQSAKDAEAIADRQIQQERDRQLALLEAERDGVKRRVALKEISAEEGIALESDIAEREYRVKREALEKELAAAKDDVKHQEQIKDQLIQLETQHTHQVYDLTTQMMTKIKGEWDSYLAKVKSTFDQVHLVSKNTFANIAFEAAKMGLESLAAHKSTELAKAEATTQSVAMRVAMETWGAIQTVAQNAWAALTSIANYAWEGIAATWAAISAIPVVGPFLAPALAAGAGAGILALAGHIHSAAGGFDIPSGMNPMTQLHQNEMVLPAELANKIRGMTDAGAGDVHLHVHSPDVAGVRRFMLDNRSALGDAVAQAIKDNHSGLRKAFGR